MVFNQLVPELSVSDIVASKRFYTDVLGFKVEYERIGDKFAFLSLGEAQLMINQINGHWETGKMEYPFGRGINFQIEIDDVDDLVKRVKDNGIVPFMDTFMSRYECDGVCYTEKEVLIQDPDGYLLRFSETQSES
ncbi:MAG: VOC family protein [Clostridiales bacterium]|nr:VOC family protein [Clostridiales bacterium]